MLQGDLRGASEHSEDTPEPPVRWQTGKCGSLCTAVCPLSGVLTWMRHLAQEGALSGVCCGSDTTVGTA